MINGGEFVRRFEPRLPHGTEHVELERILERLGLMLDTGRDVQHFALAHGNSRHESGTSARPAARRSSARCRARASARGSRASSPDEHLRSPLTIFRDSISVTFSSAISSAMQPNARRSHGGEDISSGGDAIKRADEGLVITAQPCERAGRSGGRRCDLGLDRAALLDVYRVMVRSRGLDDKEISS
jgi:hypothetical protein